MDQKKNATRVYIDIYIYDMYVYIYMICIYILFGIGSIHRLDFSEQRNIVGFNQRDLDKLFQEESNGLS